MLRQKSKILLFLIAVSFGFALVRIRATNANKVPTFAQNSHIPAQNSQLGTNQRFEELKTEMLSSWDQGAKATGLFPSVPKEFQGIVIKQAKLSKGKKVIALTFDDGPWQKNTDQILDILKRNDIKATFFMLGESLSDFPQQGKRIAVEGHAVGNHTWHHFYHHMNEEVAANEIERTSDLIYKITNIKTTLFRPPGGIMNNGVADYAKKNNYTVVMWSADSIDYSLPSVPVMVNRVIRQAKPGGIVLMHDGGGNRSQTVKALPQIIARLKAQSYSFVTIPELLQMQSDEKHNIQAVK
jgi:peptidoglycan-N-acetylglucosamine deacetylase